MMLKRLKEQEAIGDLSLINILKLQNRYSSVEISSKKANTNILNPDVAVPQETIPPGAVAKSMTHGPNAVDTEPEHNNPAVNSKSRMMMRPALDDGWDNSNWRMADDPDNRHGNPPGSSPDAGAGNGNFQFSAPVVSMPGRGIDPPLESWVSGTE